MNKTTQTNRSTINTSNSNFNADTPHWSEARSSEEEEIRMSNCMIKSNVEIINDEVKGSISEAEEIKIRKCRRKSHVYIINEEMKGSSIEEEYILIFKCRRRSRVGIIKEGLKIWTSSSKQREYPP